MLTLSVLISQLRKLVKLIFRFFVTSMNENTEIEKLSMSARR